MRATPILVFSEALAAEAALSPHGAVLVKGIPSAALLADLQNPPASRPEVVSCERSLAGPRLVLRPVAPLDPGATYSLVATRSLRDVAGNRLGGAPVVSSFTTVAASVRLVVPESVAPSNLEELVLAWESPLPSPPGPHDVRLEREDGQPVPLLAAAPYPDPRLGGFRLLEPLRPGRHYRVIARAPDAEAVLPFAVGQAPDDTPPRIVALEVRPFDGVVDLSVRLDEPAWLRVLLGRDREALAPAAWSSFAREHRVEVGGLRDGEVHLRLEARDAVGRVAVIPPLAEAPLSAVVHPLLRVEISEVVTDAQHDWSDQRCDCAEDCGVPFDARPGCDEAVGPSDEWVELTNRSGRTIDLEAGPGPWRLRVVDETPEVTTVASGRAQMYFPPASTARAWRDGDAIVVKTAGNSNNNARIELVDPWGSVVDSVTLGRDGVPSGRASGPDDEAVARIGDRWCRTRATPGAPNAGPCADFGPGR